MTVQYHRILVQYTHEMKTTKQVKGLKTKQKERLKNTNNIKETERCT